MLALLLIPSERSIASSWAGVTLCSLEMMLLIGLPGMIRGRKKFSERAAHSVSRKNPARRMMNLIVLRAFRPSPYLARPSGAAAAERWAGWQRHRDRHRCHHAFLAVVM